MAPIRSNLWSIFIKTSSGGKCKLCLCDVKTSGNTTNLKKHLQRRHPKYLTDEKNKEQEHNEPTDKNKPNVESLETENIKDDQQTFASTSTLSEVYLEDEDEDELMPSTSSSQSQQSSIFNSKTMSHSRRQSSITESFATIKSFSEGGTKATKITNALLFMVAKDNLPINTSEKEGFRYFIKTVAPMYQPPGRKKLGNLIDEKYKVLSGIYKYKLQNVPNITITTDVWTETLTTKSFLGVTIHFLLENKLNSLTIGVYELNERHTSEYLGQCILSVCKEWGISEQKVTTIVTDNGSNIVKAVTDIFGKNRHLPCFAHTLDLVASKIIKEIEPIKIIIDKVKSIVTYFKHSVVIADDLRKSQPADNILKLIQSVPTRWNSNFYMLERFVKLCEYIAPILLKHPKSPSMLDASDIEKIKDFLNILSPIEQVSKEICGEKYLTSSKVIPIIDCLFKQLEKLTPLTEEGLTLKTVTLNEMSKRFGAIELNRLLAVSTILDPRFKRLHFNNPVACANTVSFINQSISLLHEKESTGNHPSPHQYVATKTESVWAYHEELAAKYIDEKHSTSSGDIDYDFKIHLNGPILSIQSDPLTYWNNASSSILKTLAQKYLSIVGTSVPTERLFSKASNIITPNRSRLGGERLSELLFLNSLNFEEWNL